MQVTIFPIKWEISTNSTNSSTSTEKTVILYGVDSNGQHRKERFSVPSIYLIQYNELVDEETREEVSELLSPSWSKLSLYNDKMLILGNPNPLIHDGSVATWKQIYQNVPNDLATFFNFHSISPYSSLTLSSHGTLSSDESFSNGETFGERNQRVVLYDIETQGGEQFPDPRVPENKIFMISLIIIHNGIVEGYLLHLDDIGKIKETEIHFSLLQFPSEKELLNAFFILLKDSDFIFAYNGDLFDFPYILNRCKLLSLPIYNFTKNPDITILPKEDRIFTTFGYQMVTTINTPGVEFIDLLIYFRKFYPNFQNHKLNTISKTFLNQEKVGLEIATMQQYVKGKNPDELAEVAIYSIYDSILLYNLYQKLDLLSTLKKISNFLNSTIHQLLYAPQNSILQNYLSRIDPSLALKSSINAFTDLLFPPKLGHYINIFKFSYSDLLLSFLEGNELIDFDKLYELKDIGVLVYNMFSIVDDSTKGKVLDRISTLSKAYNIISINETEILITFPSDQEIPEIEGLKLIGKVDQLTMVTPTSYIMNKDVYKGMAEIWSTKIQIS